MGQQEAGGKGQGAAFRTPHSAFRIGMRGQSTAEYAIVLGVVLAAMVAMQVYVKRGAQARVKVGVDQFTQAGTTALPWLTGALPTGANDVTLSATHSQYEPYYAESNYHTVRNSETTEDVDLAAGTITKTITEAKPEETKRKKDDLQTQRKWEGQAD